MFDHIKVIRRVMTSFVLLAATGAAAADKNWSVQGDELRVTTPCAKTVTIEPSSSLKGKVEVVAHADNQQEIDNLSIAGGSAATVTRANDYCWHPGPNMQIGNLSFGVSEGPTLELTVKVPQGVAIAVKEGASADYHIGDVGGTLRLEIHGSGSVDAATAKELNLLISGSGDARVDQVGGHIEGKISGSGDLRVTKAVVASTNLTITGSGGTEIDEGDLGTTTIYLHGSGKFSGPAAGDVKMESTGSADFSLRSVKAANASVHVSGNGDVALGDGAIGSLVVSSTGSASVRVDAEVANADLSVRGSGDIRVRKVTGNVSRSEHGSGRISIGDK